MSENTSPDTGRVGGLGAIIAELGRVVWPTREELFRMTAIVVGTVIIIALFIGGIDAVLTKVSNAIYRA
ncbi:MAG: preprotein translocase subunit SecE [Candidatus Dormibacteria bacterium]